MTTCRQCLQITLGYKGEKREKKGREIKTETV